MIINFKKMRWKNILSYGNVFTEIDFISNKMTLISGKNSAGKSTMLECLSFVLYGVPYRNINKPTLVNSINGKDCVVEIEFEINNKQYFIRRGIKPAIFDIYVDGVLVDQESKSKDYQKYLEQNILRMNYKSFTQLVLLGSSDYVPFMQLSAQERREVIEDLLDIKTFSLMNGVLKEKMAYNRETVRQLDKELNNIQSKIDLQKSHIDKLNKHNQDIIDKNNDKIKILKAEINNFYQELDSKKIVTDDLLLSIKNKSDIISKINESSKSRSAATMKINSLRLEKEFFEKNSVCSTCSQNITEQHKHACTEDITKKLNAFQSVHAKLETTIYSLNDKLKEIQKIETQITEKNIELSELKNKIIVANNLISELENSNKNLGLSSKDEKEDLTLLTSFQDTFDKNKKEKDSLLEELDSYDICSALLKDSGIKTKIIQQYLPLMNKYINKYLNSMDFFVNFNIDENFKEVIKSRHRDEFQYENFSQGEKFRINMALLLTWREISRKRNSTDTNILFMDEIFDSSLDTGGTEEFLRLLVNLSKKMHVLIITHKPDSISHKFDNHIKVEKKNNFSVFV